MSDKVMSTAPQESELLPHQRILIVALVAVLVLWGANLAIGTLFTERSAPIGDSLGIANSLFSGLALGCIALTVWMQQQELRLQRRDLRLNLAEVKASRTANEAAASALARQSKLLELSAAINGHTAMVEHYDRMLKDTVVPGARPNPHHEQRIQQMRTEEQRHASALAKLVNDLDTERQMRDALLGSKGVSPLRSSRQPRI